MTEIYNTKIYIHSDGLIKFVHGIVQRRFCLTSVNMPHGQRHRFFALDFSCSSQPAKYIARITRNKMVAMILFVVLPFCAVIPPESLHQNKKIADATYTYGIKVWGHRWV